MEVAGWFGGAIINKLIDACFEYLGAKLKWPTRMEEELKRLQENQPKIQAIVSAASQAQMMIDPDSPLNKWIWQLRDAIDEADDLLDDFEYRKHEEMLARNREEAGEGSSSNWSSLFGNPPKLRRGQHDLKIDPNLEGLEEVVRKLDKILTEADIFLHLLGRIEKVQQEQQLELYKTRETGSMPKDDLIGRDAEKERIVQWLKKLPNEEHQNHVSAVPKMYQNISLLCVVSPGGMGKTTLLQHIYQDKITEQFDLKMWVCVSNRFDVNKVITDMLESLKKTTPSMKLLDALQNSLKSEVVSKKFLLILDDIWEEDEERDKSKWETILAPLACGGLGSKILLTTRMSSAALMIAKVIKQKNEVLNLKSLEEAECLQLLNTHAFAFAENTNEHDKLRSIARELVKKLYGSPLAAKVMGGVLNSNLDERHWTKVLNNDFDHNGIFSILRLSYMFLPIHLQNCFAFCSIFEQDHIFYKDDLIRMWIAVGFIHQSSCIRGETLEDIGEKYFDILVKKSFFDKTEENYKNYKETYKMHDLLHELAQLVSAQECRRIVGDEDSDFRIPETIRHLSVQTFNLDLLKKIGKFKKLRTLCISYFGYTNTFVHLLTEIFEVNRCIRLLSIKAYGQKMIPETIRCLKHLRYLAPGFPDVTLLLRSVSSLYHLQFLILEHCSRDDDLFPKDMNNLSNLRYLKSPHLNFPGIGKLKFLQIVDKFVVKNETGYRIEELEHMNDIRILEIRGLKNVSGAEEGCKAKLCDKRKLTDLSLKWKENSQNNADVDIYARVLDNLQPHNSLKNLRIIDYMGVRSAIWMNKANNLMNNLERIELAGCLEWQNLTPFGQLPFLKYLLLCDMPKAEWFDTKFHGKDFDARDDPLFPSLTKLWLYNCPNLQGLPYLPPKLKILDIRSIGWKTWNYCSTSESIPLEDLQVIQCPNITNIPLTNQIIGRSAALRRVRILECPNMISLGGHQEVETTGDCPNLILDELSISDPSVLQMEPLRSVTCIKRLTIRDNGELDSFPFDAERWFLQVSSSLRELKFIYLKSLQSLPSYLTSLSSLKALVIWDLDKLNSLPSCLSSLSSLTSLEIWKVPQLRELPNLPHSLRDLNLGNIDNLNSLPSCLPSLSSLTSLCIVNVPQLRELPDLPPSLCELNLHDMDNLSSLPSCLHSLSSLTSLGIWNVPQLQELPNLPHSLCNLNLKNIDTLNSLPSCLPRLSSLTSLCIENFPQLRELPDLPHSLHLLDLRNIDNLNSLPSCLPSLSSLTYLYIENVPQLRELPDLPSSLIKPFILQCDPELMKRYNQ